MSKWKTENHFVPGSSWLQTTISGGKVIGKGRTPTNNRATLSKDGSHYFTASDTYLGAQFRPDFGVGWGLRWRPRRWPPNSPGSSTDAALRK